MNPALRGQADWAVQVAGGTVDYAAYDTLVEIQQLLQDGTSGLDALLAAVNNRVRFDAAQTLTVIEQQQARSNIGAVALTAIGDADTDFVAVFEGALV